MTRAQQTLSLVLLASSLYLSLYLELIPLNTTIQTEIISVLPFYALISLASYLLFKLGWGVVTFKDVPEAHKELMGEIEVAKKELRAKGIDVD